VIANGEEAAAADHPASIPRPSSRAERARAPRRPAERRARRAARLASALLYKRPHSGGPGIRDRRTLRDRPDAEGSGGEVPRVRKKEATVESYRSRRFAWAVIAALVLVLAPAGLAVAQESEQPAAEQTEEISLTGQLSIDDLEGTYRLIEAESGDSIVLRGPAEMAEHVGATVKVTGKWAEDENGVKYFAVSKIERV
jgi:hypothetical protein